MYWHVSYTLTMFNYAFMTHLHAVHVAHLPRAGALNNKWQKPSKLAAKNRPEPGNVMRVTGHKLLESSWKEIHSCSTIWIITKYYKDKLFTDSPCSSGVASWSWEHLTRWASRAHEQRVVLHKMQHEARAHAANPISSEHSHFGQIQSRSKESKGTEQLQGSYDSYGIPLGK